MATRFRRCDARVVIGLPNEPLERRAGGGCRACNNGPRLTVKEGLRPVTSEADERIEFGALLRGHRLALDLTQEALAERAGLARRGVQNLERGVHRPQRETLRRLAAALDLGAAERAHFEAAARPTPREDRKSVV